MDKRIQVAFGLSFFLHLVLLASVHFKGLSKVIPFDKSPVVFMELRETAKSPSEKDRGKKSRIGKKSNTQKKERTSKKKQKNKNFGQGQGFNYGAFSPQTPNPGSFSDHQSIQVNKWAGNDVMETMGGMGLSEYSENYNFFEHLVAKLNFHIPYPKELWEHKIIGKFWVKIEIDNTGRLLRVIETSQSSPVLRAYALINIYQALEKELPRKFWYSKEKTLALQLNFDYSVSSIDNQRELQSASYFKNRFDFVRVAKIPNLLQEVMTDYARYVPPIVPTPMGPVLNFVQVYRMVTAWSEEDPIVKKGNREIFTREKMQKLLEQAKEKHHPES